MLGANSRCERLHVGCVLVSGGAHPNRVIAAGYNGFSLPGAPHRQPFCATAMSRAPCTPSKNAIADAARGGISVDGATVYVTHFPCINCAKILAASGIAAVKYWRDYRNDPIVIEILREAGITVTHL